MKVAFVAHRANYLKHYGPVIDAALQRGWDVECWLESAKNTAKAYLNITPEAVTDIWGEQVAVRSFENNTEVEGLVSQTKADAVISLRPRNRYLQKSLGEQFLTLQHSVDTFAANSPFDLATSDHVCLCSPYWWGYAVEYYAAASNIAERELDLLKSKIAYTGFAQMDVFARIQREEVRARLGIPADKKVLLALPLDVAGWPGVWPQFFTSTGLRQWRALWKGRKEPGFVSQYWAWPLFGWNDASLTNAIRKFCERNNAVLLVKGREKDPLRPAWTRIAQQTFYDESHYPATVLETIAAADLCLLFYSTAAQEAAYANVPVLCVDRPNKDTIKHRLWRRSEQGGPYNYPGVVRWSGMRQMLREFPQQSFNDFKVDAQARKEYLELYNGPADHRASERILDLVN